MTTSNKNTTNNNNEKMNIPMAEITRRVRAEGMTIAWTYGNDWCDPYPTKKAAVQCRKENFGQLYTNAEFDEYMPVYQAVFCGDEMYCTLDKYIDEMSEQMSEKKPTLYVYRNEQGDYEVTDEVITIHPWPLLFTAKEGAEWYCVVENEDDGDYIIDYDADPEKWTYEKMKEHAQNMADCVTGEVDDIDDVRWDDEYSIQLRKCVIELVREITDHDEYGEYTMRDYRVFYDEIVREVKPSKLHTLDYFLKGRFERAKSIIVDNVLTMVFGRGFYADISEVEDDKTLHVKIRRLLQNGVREELCDDEYEFEDVLEVLKDFVEEE